MKIKISAIFILLCSVFLIPYFVRADFSPGALVKSGKTIYVISGSYKIPFTNYKAFTGMGYALKNVIQGDLQNYTSGDAWAISNASQRPWGSWVLYNKTIYYLHETGMIPVPSMDVFLQNGGNLKFVAKANKYDIEAIKKSVGLAVLNSSDERIYGQVARTSAAPESNASTPTPSASTPVSTAPVTPPTTPPTTTPPITTPTTPPVTTTPSTSSVTLRGDAVMPAGNVGAGYSNPIGFYYNQVGRGNQIVFQLSGLPPGISYTGNGQLDISGLGYINLIGVPTQAGTFTVSIHFSDALGLSTTLTKSITINPAIPVVTGPPVGTTNDVGTITLLTPNGLETLTNGSTYHITWSSSANLSTVMLSNKNYSNISDSITTALIPNTGSYDWTVKKFGTGFESDPTKFKIEIMGLEPGVGTVIDQSDNYFTIQ